MNKKSVLYRVIVLQHNKLQKEIEEENLDQEKNINEIKFFVEHILNSSKEISEIGERKELRFILRFWGNYIYSKSKEVIDIDIDNELRKPRGLTYYVDEKNLENENTIEEKDNIGFFEYAKEISRKIGYGVAAVVGVTAGVKLVSIAYDNLIKKKDDNEENKNLSSVGKHP